MPCMELFAKQPEEYQERVLLAGKAPVISVEAGSTVGWDRYSHVQLGVETFGKSGPYQKVYEFFGLTEQIIAEKAAKVIEFYKTHPVYNMLDRVKF